MCGRNFDFEQVEFVGSYTIHNLLINRVNNCVGINNQKYFIQFLLYVAVAEFYTLCLFGYRAYFCLNNIKMCVDEQGIKPGVPVVFIMSGKIYTLLFYTKVRNINLNLNLKPKPPRFESRKNNSFENQKPKKDHFKHLKLF